MGSFRSEGLKWFGVTPEVEPLQNGRFRITVRCEHDGERAWQYQNRANIFPDFGTLYETTFGETPIDLDPDETPYPNAILVSKALEYIPQKDTSVVTLVYETITSSFVQVKDDNIDYDLNGLRRVTRTVIATAGTNYTNVIGTATLSHTDAGRGTSTLYLASTQTDDTDASRVVTEVWLEPGKVMQEDSLPSLGKKTKTERFFKILPTISDPIIEKREENYNGFEVWTVTTIVAPDGESITDGDDDKETASYNKLVSWQRPGCVGVREFDVGTTGSARGVQLWHSWPPSNMKLYATIKVFYSKNSTIDGTEFDTVTGGSDVEFWNPSTWAVMRGEVSDALNNINIGDINQTLRGFRVITSDDDDYSNTGDTIKETGNVKHGVNLLAWQNGSYFGKYTNLNNNTSDNTTVATVTVSGGPPRPEGKTWVLDFDATEDFSDIDGVKYYRKTYVYAYVPDFEAGEDVFDG